MNLPVLPLLIHTSLTEDLAGKVIPAAKSLIGRMVPTIFVTSESYQPGRLRQIVGVSRGTDLIIHNADCPALFANAQHGLDEVLAVHAKYPRDTDDERTSLPCSSTASSPSYFD